MPTTTKMGIVYPSSTDLVKDGATAMGTISTTVDSKTGLVLISTTSFSAVSSQSFNSVFNANYTNYRIISNTTASGSTGYLNFRLRASGSDITASNYTNAAMQAPYASASLSNDPSGASQSTWRNYGYIDSVQDYAVVQDIFSPFATAWTSYVNLKARLEYGNEFASGVYKATTSADGFTIYPTSGTISGSVSIYGFNK